MSAETIATIWAFIIATAVFLYVCMDGFDLGLGILFPWIDGRDERDLAVNTVAPVWDGNETWLVMGGGGLFAVFPLAYATILPALYMPLILMLLALIFRGVSFEMRFRVRDAGAAPVVGPRLLGRQHRRRLLPGHRARRAGAGRARGGPRLCRRLVGLALALLRADRAWRCWPATGCSARAGWCGRRKASCRSRRGGWRGCSPC